MSTQDYAGQRLTKVIARAGVASRREAEQMITEGRVRVNGEVILYQGRLVDPSADRIEVDGHPLPEPPPHRYYLYYKPRGVLTTLRDPEGRPTILDRLDELPYRVEPVGRLDLNTEGALLLTNDGELANRLAHPSSHIPKRYLAKVWKVPSEKTLNRLRAGLRLDDGRTAPAKVRIHKVTDTGNAWVEITVTEGRNRLVRRMFAHVGHPVSKLRRESFATLSIRGMERGAIRELTGDEVRRLHDLANGVKPARAGHGASRRTGFARPKPPPVKPGYKKKRARRKRGVTGDRKR